MNKRKILVQTTIAANADDWDIDRFSLLVGLLAAQRDAQGQPVFEVIARNREPGDVPDTVLSTLDTSDIDVLWLLAVDTGNGLHAQDCAAIGRFRRRGGGLL